MVYALSRWSLKDLYPGFDSPELEASFKQVEEQISLFESLRAELAPEMEKNRFLEIVKHSEETRRLIHQIDAFASLSFAADTQDQAAQSLQARVQQF